MDYEQIFISYRRQDSIDIAGRIYDRLKESFGKSVIFRDLDSIPLGINFKNYLNEKVTQCRILLVIIGKEWLNIKNKDGKKKLNDPTDYVRIEIVAALKRKMCVIPLFIQGTSAPEERELPKEMGELIYHNGMNVRCDPDFHSDMDYLIKNLKKILGQTTEAREKSQKELRDVLKKFIKNSHIHMKLDELLHILPHDFMQNNINYLPSIIRASHPSKTIRVNILPDKYYLEANDIPQYDRYRCEIAILLLAMIILGYLGYVYIF